MEEGELQEMTKVTVLQCDSCNTLVDEEVVRTSDVTISKCAICGEHYCNWCGEEHAKDETGLNWK